MESLSFVNFWEFAVRNFLLTWKYISKADMKAFSPSATYNHGLHDLTLMQHNIWVGEQEKHQSWTILD